MRIIVSLTSYPPRIGGVYKVIESLFRQTMQVDEIVLYLSLEEFPKEDKDLPETLRMLIGRNRFRIKWVQENLKSHKKYYYALQEYKDAVVITVDDDTIYANTMVSDLIKSYRQFPDAVSARRVRIVLKKDETLELYNKWEREIYLEEYIDMPRMDLCAIGVGGVCYPPLLINDDWLNKAVILNVAENQDDLWLKYNEIMNNIPVVFTKSSQKDIIIENSQRAGLAANNLYGDGNDKCVYDLFKLLKEQNTKKYQMWFQDLMTWEEYIVQKKNYYLCVFSSSFDRVGNAAIYLYGAGEMAKCILKILEDLGLIRRITSIIVSDKTNNVPELSGIKVKSLSEINQNEECGIIFGVNSENRREILDMLKGYNYQNIELDMRVIMRYYQNR